MGQVLWRRVGAVGDQGLRQPAQGRLVSTGPGGGGAGQLEGWKGASVGRGRLRRAERAHPTLSI